MTRRILTAATIAAAALLPAGAALALGASSQPVRQTLAAPGPPAGDAAGIALARLANAYYAKRPVMGVELRIPTYPGIQVHRLLLKRGLIEGALVSLAIGKDRGFIIGSPTGDFERYGGERCWYRRPGSSPREPMITVRGSLSFAPISVGSLTRLEVSERDPKTGRHHRIQYKIDPGTGRIATIAQEHVATVRTLPAPLKIPVPKPLCPDSE
ncbi:MAG: hypothetical protein QOD86_2045 [Miltoncostaeaceae bacterium]|jgi:hypothetical protein|nr:hypothetical protein [Miltoncostaeaceae bacterium]